MLQPRDLRGRTAISYIRWSSGRQTDGDSLRRQTESAERFCSTYGLTLDRTLVDAATSAYTGSNLEASLGKFIKEVEAGTIPADRILLLEAMDRLSRINPMKIVPVFIALLETGLTLVTLSDGRVHSRASYYDNSMHLMMSLMSMQAAHEYSAKLSKRVSDEWGNRANRARQGRVRMSKVPFWIDQQTQELNHRADDARLVFKLAKDGLGQRAIASHFNARGVPSPSGGTWSKSSVQDTIDSPAAYGSLMIKGEEVKAYYPALITETEWLAIQQRNRMRYRNPQAANTANLFPRLLRCGVCGSRMNLSTTRSRGRTWRYLACDGRALGRTGCAAPNWRYDEFEEEFLSTFGSLAVPIPDATATAEEDRTSGLEDDVRALEAKRANVLAGVQEADTADARKVLLDMASGLSREIDAKRGELIRLRESLARHLEATNSVADIAADRERLIQLAKEDRPEAQRLISNLVERIDLETDGTGSASRNAMRRYTVTMRNGWSHARVIDPGEGV
ncbi:hypothetical protein GOB08_11695 [Sinorhizobium meliloti]|nr:hypothetical protein [Sinorhizobium meliloti]MDX0449604.1 hypothetical protein [Sinorhizobium medicae]MDX1058354.1 hypothetical protein [Sinorhizobium medicae]